ncbi:MAG: hypothetical protein ABS81_21040 [Pseudonocardia sp. SCN 72-86]|nr:MAG: hypothetical protein ABS81_21040 [Pseudonocardia sp. SCN 72-86]
MVDAIVEDHLRLMVDAVNVTTHTDRSVLWANAAAAMAGAFLALSWGSSDHSRYLDEATEAFAANAQLDGLVALTSFRLGGEDWFMSRRRRCCLAIRARASNRGEVYCASCPILSEDEQGRRYLDAAIRFQAVERVVSADGL